MLVEHGCKSIVWEKGGKDSQFVLYDFKLKPKMFQVFWRRCAPLCPSTRSTSIGLLAEVPRPVSGSIWEKREVPGTAAGSASPTPMPGLQSSN